MLKILTIFHKIETIFKEKYRDEPQDFIRGFDTCLSLFEIGIKKGTVEGQAVETYANLVKIHELERVIKDQRNIIEKKDLRIKMINEGLKEKSIILGTPTVLYAEFLIETPVGNFTIVANMDADTIKGCLLSFHMLHEFKQIDEGKSKLLMFINSKRANGFRAFKNTKEAIREGARL